MTYWSLEDKKALIVDDFPAMRSTLRSLLQSLNCEDIKLAKDAKEALDLIMANRFDFILCDYNLGEGKNGQQILEDAKYLDILPYSTVFMMITAENTSQMVMGVLDWVPDDYVQKPITKTVILTRLKKLLARKADLVDISHALQGSKDYEKALKLCDAKLAEKPAAAFELMKLKAELLIKTGNYSQAVDHCKKIFELREINSIGLLLGQALFASGRLDEAEAALNKVLENSENYTLAYDLLAKIKVKRGDLIEAQRLLENAVAQSPKAILRQRELGQIAYKNGNIGLAEKSFKQAVKLGQYSCYKNVKDYTGLADTLTKSNQEVDAIKVIHSIKKEFQSSPSALLEASIVEARLLKDMKKDELSLKAVHAALAALEKNADYISSELILDLAETCVALGQTEQALSLVEQAVRNKPDDASMLINIRKAFANKAMSDNVEQLIEKSIVEVRDINHKGVILAQQGKIEESIALFMEAANALPQNITINLNAAHSLILQMTQQGVTKERLQQSKQYLDKVKAINPANEKLLGLVIKFNKLAST